MRVASTVKNSMSWYTLSHSKNRKYTQTIATKLNYKNSLGILNCMKLTPFRKTGDLRKQPIDCSSLIRTPLISTSLFFSKAALVTKLRNEEIFKPWNVHRNYLVYQSSTATLKQLTEWSKDEPHWMSLAVSKLCGSWFIKFLLIFVSWKMLRNHLFCPKIQILTCSAYMAVHTYTYSAVGKLTYSRHPCLAPLSVIWMTSHKAKKCRLWVSAKARLLPILL